MISHAAKLLANFCSYQVDPSRGDMKFPSSLLNTWMTENVPCPQVFGLPWSLSHVPCPKPHLVFQVVSLGCSCSSVACYFLTFMRPWIGSPAWPSCVSAASVEVSVLFFFPLSSGITSWTQYPLPKGPPWPPWSPSPHSPNSYIISDQPMIFPFFNILDNNDFGEIYFFFLLDWLVCKVAVLVWVEICFPD